MNGSNVPSTFCVKISLRARTNRVVVSIKMSTGKSVPHALANRHWNLSERSKLKSPLGISVCFTISIRLRLNFYTILCFLNYSVIKFLLECLRRNV